MATERLPLLHLYIDETGSRHPDKPGATAKHGYDWFALGGLLIRQEDEAEAKRKLTAFLAKWPQIRAPLHFTDMRAEKKAFAWLGKLNGENKTRFWSDLRRLLVSLPGAATGCVIDRPGYTARGYGSRVGDAKWLLCRSAFDILIDRSGKYAKSQIGDCEYSMNEPIPLRTSESRIIFGTLKLRDWPSIPILPPNTRRSLSPNSRPSSLASRVRTKPPE